MVGGGRECLEHILEVERSRKPEPRTAVYMPFAASRPRIRVWMTVWTQEVPGKNNIPDTLMLIGDMNN